MEPQKRKFLDDPTPAKEAGDQIDCPIEFKTATLDWQSLLGYLTGLIEKNMQFPCVILLDPNMPKLHNFEALKKIKDIARIKNVPVVMLLPEGDKQSDVEKAYEFGADAYMVEPDSPHDLCKHLRETVCQSA